MARKTDRFSCSLITATSALLVLLAFFITPAGCRLMTLGRHYPASFGFASFAWLCSFCLFAAGLFLYAMRRRIKVKDLALAAVSLVGTFVLMEAGLAATGFKPPYRLFPRVPKQADWFQTDTETGDHFVAGKYDPSWPINRDGHIAPFDFTPENGAKAPYRILLLGDSYTFGIGASSYQQTWAKILETMLRRGKDVAIWNTGIPGIGQRQELLSLRKYFPLLRPQLVILAFCLNDFEDNLFPIGNHYAFEDGLWVLRHAMQPDGTTRTMSPEEAYLRAVRPERPQEYLCTSRVLSLLIAAIRKADCLMSGVSPDVRPSRIMPRGMEPDVYRQLQTETTTQLLREIYEYICQNHSRFLLAPIPLPSELGEQCPRCVFDMCKGLGIECVDLGTVLEKSDYLPDGHWNASGHQKVAKRLAEKVASLL